MRAICLVFVAAYVGCGPSTCGDLTTFKDDVKNDAPGTAGRKLMVQTAGCSTCEDASLQLYWAGATSATTGTLDVVIYPGCFVKNVMLSEPANNGALGGGNYSYYFNAANCGDQIDYLVTATNNSNVTLTDFELSVNCHKFIAKQ